MRSTTGCSRRAASHPRAATVTVYGSAGEVRAAYATHASPVHFVVSVACWSLRCTALPPPALAMATPSAARKSFGGAHATRVRAFHSDAARSGFLEPRRTSPYQPTDVPTIAPAVHHGDPARLPRWHDAPLGRAIPKDTPHMCPTEPSQLLLTCRGTFQSVLNVPASRAGTAMNTACWYSSRNATHLCAPEAGPSSARTTR